MGVGRGMRLERVSSRRQECSDEEGIGIGNGIENNIVQLI